MAKFTGQLYQLRSTSQLHQGAYVAINGPWDTFGMIVSSSKTPDGEWLNLIRGVQPRPGTKPVAQF